MDGEGAGDRGLDSKGITGKSGQGRRHQGADKGMRRRLLQKLEQGRMLEGLGVGGRGEEWVMNLVTQLLAL